MFEVYSRVVEIDKKGKAAALCTVVESKGSTPRKPGSRMIVYPDGSIESTVGGGALEKKVITEALAVIEQGEAKLLHIALRENEADSVGGICGGELQVFIEPIGTQSRLIIFGGGHVGCTLAQIAQHLDVKLVVIDDRDAQSLPGQFPDSAEVLCIPFEQALERIKPSPRDYVVIMTYKYTHDMEILNQALQTQAKYIGMIGSEVKCMRVMHELGQRGVSLEQLNRVHAPIGLPIGAHNPAEVAVSVMAQIVKVMNGID